MVKRYPLPDMKKLPGIAQKAFMLHYPDKDFIKIFGRNYLDEPSNDNWEPD